MDVKSLFWACVVRASQRQTLQLICPDCQ